MRKSFINYKTNKAIKQKAQKIYLVKDDLKLSKPIESLVNINYLSVNILFKK